MSSSNEKWEEALADSIKKHEFDFDPSAWAELDQLMNQAGVATNRVEIGGDSGVAPPDLTPITTAGGRMIMSTKLILGLLTLFTVVFLTVWLTQRREQISLNAKASDLSSGTSVPTLVVQKDDSSLVVPKATVSVSIRNEAVTEIVVKKPAEPIIPSLATDRPIKSDTASTLITLAQENRRKVTVIQTLPRRFPPALEYVNLATSLVNKKFSINPPNIPQRPTLFPEVKDKY